VKAAIFSQLHHDVCATRHVTIVAPLFDEAQQTERCRSVERVLGVMHQAPGKEAPLGIVTGSKIYFCPKSPMKTHILGK